MKIIKSLRNKLNKDQRRKNNDDVEVIDISQVTANAPTTMTLTNYGDIKVVDVDVDDIEKVIVIDDTTVLRVSISQYEIVTLIRIVCY